MSPDDYSRIREAFVKASALSKKEQAAFLKSLRDESPEVCTEVESLLQFDTRQTLVEVDKSQPTTAVGASAPTVAVAPSKGPTLRQLFVTRHLKTRRGMMLATLLLATAVMFFGAMWLQQLTRRSVDKLVGDSLQGVNATKRDLVETWFEGAQFHARSWAASDQVRKVVLRIVDEAEGMSAEELAMSPMQDELETAIKELVRPTLLNEHDEDDIRFAVWNRERTLVADWSRNPNFFGQSDSDTGARALSRVFRGENSIYIPSTTAYTEGYEFIRRPEIALTVPVYRDDGEIGAALLVGGMFQENFEATLRRGYYGESAESYAVNRDGTLVSDVRFRSQLDRIGLVDRELESASLAIRISDPGRDLLTLGIRVEEQGSAWNLTGSYPIGDRRRIWETVRALSRLPWC